MTTDTPVLQTHQLDIGYTTSRRADVLVGENITLSLNSGELVCLLGPNGVGKSTLMRTIAGMQKPLAGRIRLMGDDIAALKPGQLATRLSVVLTDRPNLGLLNGYALVALGRHPHTDWTGRLSSYDDAVIHWAIEAVGAADLAGHPVMELSDGQRQKLMIARALAQESELILLDEPTAFLDLPRRAEIMRWLRQLAVEAGRAILLSTHDLDLALRSADKLWLMSGKNVYAGSPEDLVLNGTFEAAFQDEGVNFDRATGTFSVEHPTGTIVAVSGHGIPQIWTQRALKRAGFTLAEADSRETASIQIEISGDGQHPVWHLFLDGKESTHGSIQDLLLALQDEKAAQKTLD